MILYRYLNTEYSLQLLQTEKWKVSRLLELNDPADCRPTLTGAPDQQNDEANEVFAQDYLSALHENIGIVSFSERVSDPVLWSHYADAHRGLAIGFDFILPHPQFQKVTYHDERPTINYEEAERLKPGGEPTGEFVMKIITNGFSQKAKTWEYEEEYRKFVYLNRCEMIGPHYFETAPMPSHIVLGIRCKITESDVKRVCFRHGRRGRLLQVTRGRSTTKDTF